MRRILRATPTAAGPSSDRHSVFLIGFWRYFSMFWDRFLMISGSNLGGLPLPEHLWDLLAAAGGSPVLQGVIFNGFWFPFGVPPGSLCG